MQGTIKSFKQDSRNSKIIDKSSIEDLVLSAMDKLGIDEQIYIDEYRLEV